LASSQDETGQHLKTIPTPVVGWRFASRLFHFRNESRDRPVEIHGVDRSEQRAKDAYPKPFAIEHELYL